MSTMILQMTIADFQAHKNCIFDAHWIGYDHILTSSGDSSIRFHDLVSERLVSQFKGHGASVKNLALRPNYEGSLIPKVL